MKENYRSIATAAPLSGILAEYHMLVHTGESFVPHDADKKMEYWHRELGKTWNFLMEHEKHYLSYMQETATPVQETATPEKIHPHNAPQPGDSLRRMITASEKYMKYIEDKLTGLRGHRRSNFFHRA